MALSAMVWCVALAVVLDCYPGVACRLSLVVVLLETFLMRPDTANKRFVLLRRVCEEIEFRARGSRLRSDTRLLAAVLGDIVNEASNSSDQTRIFDQLRRVSPGA